MVALENGSTFPIIPKILCSARALLWLTEKLWVLMPQPLSCAPQALVITGLNIAEGIVVLNINYKQVNMPLCSDSHVLFSKAGWQGFWPFHGGFWSELPSKAAPYLQPGAAYARTSLQPPSLGSASPGTECCPLPHVRAVWEQQQKLTGCALRWLRRPVSGAVLIKHFLMKGKEARVLFSKNKNPFMVFWKLLYTLHKWSPSIWQAGFLPCVAEDTVCVVASNQLKKLLCGPGAQELVNFEQSFSAFSPLETLFLVT